MSKFTKVLYINQDWVRVAVMKDNTPVIDRVYWYFMRSPWAIKIALYGANRWGDKLIKIFEKQEA